MSCWVQTKMRANFCKNGHSKTEENWNSNSQCRVCVREYAKTHHEQYKKTSRYSQIKKDYAKSFNRKEYIKKREHELTYRYIKAKSSAKSRGLVFNFSKNEFGILIKNPCHYCQKVTFGIYGGVGLDRIDNTKGYEFANVLPCCGDCNKHKNSSWTVKEMEVAIKAINVLRGESK